jgi:[glutamine synthetase] adenylyltransferase / [glutamine synthetase]-adenylyl-L-tyrosine phosphorylase
MQRLQNYPFQDPARAEREFNTLAANLPPAVINRVDLLLAASPAPEQALHYLINLQDRQPGAFERLTRSTSGLRYLIAVFSNSRFLAEEVLEHPDWAGDLLESTDMSRALSAEELRAKLLAQLPSGVPPPIELARFRRRQILRIVVRDVLELGLLPEITGELTNLADVLLDVAYERIYASLVAHYGTPRAGSASAPASRFAVLALGKMGGQELNYSSDIDLMFLYSDNGETDGTRPISNQEFFKRAANQLTALLSAYTAEGMCYRVDLRLRPDGSLGEVCISLDGARRYYQDRARDWEWQMMIKARVAAGDVATGRSLLEFVEPLSYKSTLDFSVVESMSVTRERLNEKLLAKQGRKPGSIDVKLGRGGIRDIEFLVQCLQRLYGGSDLWVRHGGTMLALARLQDKGHLTGAEYGRLASAYRFLRSVEHRLQFDEDRQTHTLPWDPAALELIARRVPGVESSGRLVEEIRRHFAQVTEIYDRVVYAQSTAADAPPAPSGQKAATVVLALDQTAPALAEALKNADLVRGYRAFEHFLERQAGDLGLIAKLNRNPSLTKITLDLFEHSPYFAEELIRTPELLEDVACHSVNLLREISAARDPAELRKLYRREMARIQTESICAPHPIFDTLERTSNLADGIIARAYALAVAETQAALAPSRSDYRPENQMHVIALGRLGMREFDMASDADLVFVLADSDAEEMPFWTKVAGRIVDLITAYTGSGVLFAVDTRLRPNGSAGPMVQTETAVKDYFNSAAEAWEGVAYMKARTVAGDQKRAERFLLELQEVDWRRYGQSGRSRDDLRRMRQRLEREQGPSQPLKAGRGGYHDIDFLLLYLRLKSAGVFFKVLNTPARIEVLEQMGHLSREQAAFLAGAARFYRAIDHGLRVISGHAEGKLPKSESHLELLGEVVARWSPIPLSDLGKIRTETRGIFDRFFG